LTNLTNLELRDNQISDISPLLENTGILGGIQLQGNPLSNTALSTHIPALEARGITVAYDMLEGVVLFKDANLEKAIRDALGIPTELLKKEDLAELNALTYEGKEGAKISDLTGLEHCTSLTSLNFYGNLIGNVGPLTNLTNLARLDLNGNQISNLDPLSSLINLTYLSLAHNQISNVSALSNLTSLTRLSLYVNQISDINPISNLTNLKVLFVDRNPVSEISPLSKLASLKELLLYDTKISDITPLIQNTGISGEIKLKNSPLSNTSLSIHIPALEARGITVEYDEAPVDMIKMSDSDFEASLRQAVDIPTDTLTPSNTSAIVDLDLTNAGIVDLDVGALKALTSLKSINLTNNPLSPNAILVQIPELESAGITVDLGESATAKVELSVPESTLAASLASTTDITITVTDADGNSVKRETIGLTVNQGTIQDSVVNNGDGTYSATYAATDTVGEVQISAVTSNGTFATTTIQLVVALVSTEGSTMEISNAAPKTGEQVSIVITLLSENGLPLSGKPVSLAVEPSEGTAINQPVVITDAKGKVVATFTSDISGMKVIKASSGELELDKSLAAIFKPAIDPSWLASLYITSANTNSDPQSVQFGMAAQGTNGYDDGLDTVAPPALPAPPDPIKLDAFFAITDNLL